jgi:hypothetical protein
VNTSLPKLIAAATLPLFIAPLSGAVEPTHPAHSMLKAHIMLTPKEVKWGECPKALPPGGQCATIEGDPTVPNALFTLRAKLPDNYRIPPHFHPADEHVTVLSGTFNMGLGEKLDTSAANAMTAGSFMVMPKGTRHFAWTRGETIVQVHAIGPWGLTYVNAEDDPRKREMTSQTRR